MANIDRPPLSYDASDGQTTPALAPDVLATVKGFLDRIAKGTSCLDKARETWFEAASVNSGIAWSVGYRVWLNDRSFHADTRRAGRDSAVRSAERLPGTSYL